MQIGSRQSDKQQLLHSICGYYGSERLNAEEYLKRFIDIEYRLPDPDIDKFTNYLYDIYEFDSFFASEARKEYFQRDKEKEEFLRVIKKQDKPGHTNTQEFEADRYAANKTSNRDIKRAVRENYKHAKKDQEKIYKKEFNKLASEDMKQRNKALNDKTIPQKVKDNYR